MLGPDQACPQEQRAAAKVTDIGAKFLDRGNVHIWPHSHYLIRKCDEMGRWVQLTYSLCRCRYRKVRNVQVQKWLIIWWEKKLAPLSSFILHGPWLFNSFVLLIPLLSWPLSNSLFCLVILFLPVYFGPCLYSDILPLYAQALLSLKLPSFFSAFEQALDVHLLLSCNLIVKP